MSNDHQDENWITSYISGQPFEMINEYFEEVKPGLSSYAEKPQDVSTDYQSIESYYCWKKVLLWRFVDKFQQVAESALPLYVLG